MKNLLLAFALLASGSANAQYPQYAQQICQQMAASGSPAAATECVGIVANSYFDDRGVAVCAQLQRYSNSSAIQCLRTIANRQLGAGTEVCGTIASQGSTSSTIQCLAQLAQSGVQGGFVPGYQGGFQGGYSGGYATPQFPGTVIVPPPQGQLFAPPLPPPPPVGGFVWDQMQDNWGGRGRYDNRGSNNRGSGGAPAVDSAYCVIQETGERVLGNQFFSNMSNLARSTRQCVIARIRGEQSGRIYLPDGSRYAREAGGLSRRELSDFERQYGRCMRYTCMESNY